MDLWTVKRRPLLLRKPRKRSGTFTRKGERTMTGISRRAAALSVVLALSALLIVPAGAAASLFGRARRTTGPPPRSSEATERGPHSRAWTANVFGMGQAMTRRPVRHRPGAACSAGRLITPATPCLHRLRRRCAGTTPPWRPPWSQRRRSGPTPPPSGPTTPSPGRRWPPCWSAALGYDALAGRMSDASLPFYRRDLQPGLHRPGLRHGPDHPVLAGRDLPARAAPATREQAAAILMRCY